MWKETNDAKLTVKAKSGWKVSSVNVHGDGDVYSRYRNYRFTESGNISLDLGDIAKVKDHYTNISISFRKGDGTKSKYEYLTISLR